MGQPDCCQPVPPELPGGHQPLLGSMTSPVQTPKHCPDIKDGARFIRQLLRYPPQCMCHAPKPLQPRVTPLSL